MKRFSEITTITSLACVMFVLHLSAFVARSEKLETSDEIAAQARPVAPKPEQKSFRGEVVSVDPSAEALVARAKNEVWERSFDLTFAKFLKGTRLEQMKVGDGVALKYVVNDNKNFVTFIVAIPARSGRQTTNGEVKPSENARLEADRM